MPEPTTAPSLMTETDLLRQAVELVVTAQFPSPSFLQRRLRINYARADFILRDLEALGVVGPQDGIAQRKMLVQPHDLAAVLAQVGLAR